MTVWIIWFAIAAVLFIIEMLTLTFYLLWIAIGALVGAIISVFAPDLLMLQLLAGALVSLILTIFTKPLTRRIRSGIGFRNSFDHLVGKEGIVVALIEPGRLGMVKVGNELWSASAQEVIEINALVIIHSCRTTILEVRVKGGAL